MTDWADEKAREWFLNHEDDCGRITSGDVAHISDLLRAVREEDRAEIERLKAESAGRMKVLEEKAEEAKAEWLRAERAEAAIERVRGLWEHDRFYRLSGPQPCADDCNACKVEEAIRG